MVEGRDMVRTSSYIHLSKKNNDDNNNKGKSLVE